jgi:hypothetical protein
VEADGVRILECRCDQPPVLCFLLSTKPTIAPPQIVKSVKGRLQHLIRDGLSDHVHLTLGCAIGESPEAVGLTYLNNLACAHGMQALFRHSYYVGTFGEYDLEAIRRSP